MVFSLQVKSSEQPSADSKNEGDEEEEESRPPMDLFKAIFATSSDEKSSSSQGESEDEEDEKDDEKGQAEPQPPNLFDINPSHLLSSTTSSQQTGNYSSNLTFTTAQKSKSELNCRN